MLKVYVEQIGAEGSSAAMTDQVYQLYSVHC